MCSFCPDTRLMPSLNLAAANRCEQSIDEREELARQLCAQKGVHHDALLPNTLDEEPQDGVLPCGAPGHFAWREMLSGADRIIARERGTIARLERV